MIVGKGNATSLWRDTWVCETPLKDKFPQLFQISNEPEITVAGAANVGWHMSFRRWLNEGFANPVQAAQRFTVVFCDK